SMRLDYDFHRPLEIHYIYSRPIEIARQAGFHMPKLEMLESELKFLSQDF
ncbi:MAG: 2-dehydropantoate 2-reductase, partial [Prevotella sp.]|nr:2-dehydropantoate 2-reductase [Prevotella sp.]